MTRRMLTAIANPHLDILGPLHRPQGVGRGGRADRRAGTVGTGAARPARRATSTRRRCFAACVEHGKAVEINSRPDRLDPPKRLLRLAVEAGCLFSIDTDAHAPGQLDWLRFGCERAALCGVDADRVVNTWPATAS